MQVTIRPRHGLRVPAPDGVILPVEGRLVELDLFWRRRLDDGDVEIVPAEHAPKGAAK